MEINLQPFKNSTSSVFTGRPQGEQAREKLNLSSIDNNEENVDIIIPADTTSFNPSFFLGLLFHSIQKLGIEKFKEKYNFIISTDDPNLHDVIENNINDGYRNAINSLKNKNGLFSGL